jgi:uncharacterized membrane protein (DUF485 family)
MKIVRGIGAVIVGMIAFFLLVLTAEWISHRYLSFPARHELWQDSNQMSAFMATLAMRDLLLVLAGWLIATFIAIWLTTKIARGPTAGFVVGALLLLAGIQTALVAQQPLWFSIASFVIYIGATWAGVRAGVARRVAYEG